MARELMGSSLLMPSNSTDDISMALVADTQTELMMSHFGHGGYYPYGPNPDKRNSDAIDVLHHSLSRNRRQTIISVFLLPRWQISWTTFTSTEQQAA